MIAGVAGGVAETLDADPSIIRIVWALLMVLTGGLALLVYIVMAIVVPERPEGMPVASSTATPWAAGAGAAGAAGTTEPVPEGSWRAPVGSAVPLAGGASSSAGAASSSAGSASSSAGAAPSAAGRRRDPADRTRAGLIAGLLLILLGGFFLIRQFIPAIDLSLWWPTAAIIAGILLVVLALLPPRRLS
jgi:phage shock protein C